MGGDGLFLRETWRTIGFANSQSQKRPLEAGRLWTGSLDEYLKLARGDVLFRRTEKAPHARARARACGERVYILLRTCSNVAGTNLGIPAWNQGALRSSASSLRLFRLSVLSGKGGGVGVEPWVLPSAGTELLDVLICDLLFDLNSASVPESGQLCPILKIKEPSFTNRREARDRGEKGASGEPPVRLGLPVVLDVEVLRVGDGRVDGVVEALGRRDFVVRRPRTLWVDDRLVYVAPGMGPVRRAGRRAATADERAAVILAVQPKNVASTCQTHRQPLYQRRLVR